MKKCIFFSHYLIVCLWFVIDSTNASSASHHRGDLGVNISRILDSFFNSGYDKRVRPNYGGAPVEVGVTMYIVSISSVSEVQMDFTTDFYFRQTWKDSRLTFEKRPNIVALSVGSEVAQKIWVPDTFFANEKSAYFHEATTPNTFLRIGFDGEVLRSIRLTVTASCPMDLQYFPMDRQRCTIEIESYGYSMMDIRYKWVGEDSVKIDANLVLPQFSIAGHRQSAKEINLSTGNYSRLLCEIQFVRSMGYYMIQIYVPASLIVIISWVSFWLHRNATPARVQLGVVTVLTMTTLMSSTNSQLPKISYVKSIDVFLGTCFVMVFAALLEYAAVGYIGKRISMRKNRFQQMAKAAEEKRKKMIEAEESMRCRREDVDTPPPPPPPPHVAHFATLRRSVANTGCTGPGHARPPHVFHRPQDVRLEMVGSKPTSAVAQSPTSADAATTPARSPGRSGAPGLQRISAVPPKNLNNLFGVSPSDIDKYSRVVFPVCFVCFNLMYWIIFMHISDILAVDFENTDD